MVNCNRQILGITIAISVVSYMVYYYFGSTTRRGIFCIRIRTTKKTTPPCSRNGVVTSYFTRKIADFLRSFKNWHCSPLGFKHFHTLWNFTQCSLTNITSEIINCLNSAVFQGHSLPMKIVQLSLGVGVFKYRLHRCLS